MRHPFWTMAGRFLVSALLTALLSPPLLAQPLSEVGSLRGFLMGSEPGCAYDNWISHTSEGIARNGYNDYGPNWLDPQTDGFGGYRRLYDDPASRRALALFSEVFDHFYQGNLNQAALLLADSSASFRYEAVSLEDPEAGVTYHILREQLDMSYLDNGRTPQDPSDDVVGGFRNGWGVFVLNPQASRPYLMLQIVHPNDDFMAPPMALELFQRLDAGVLMIHGSGREVVVSESGMDYSNRDSLSDPSRSGPSVLGVATDRFYQRYREQYPRAGQIWQLHSFDGFGSPSNLPVILSAGYDHREPGLPLRDMDDYEQAVINQTSQPVFAAGEFHGDVGTVDINDYYALNSYSAYRYYLPSGGYVSIPVPGTYRGDPANLQYHAAHDGSLYHEEQVVEDFIHVEICEFPPLFADAGLGWEEFLSDVTLPPTWQSFEPLLAFYEPFFAAMEQWYDWFDSPGDAALENATSVLIYPQGDGRVNVRYRGRSSSRLAGYQVLLDHQINEDSPVIAGFENRIDMRRASQEQIVLDGLVSELEGDLQLAIRTVDLAGNEAALVGPYPVTLADTLGMEVELPPDFDFPLADWPAWLKVEVDQVWDLQSIMAVLEHNGQEIIFQLESLGARYGSNSEAFGAPIPLALEELAAGDELRWYVETADYSDAGNTSRHPETGERVITLVDGPGIGVLHDFETGNDGMVLWQQWQRGQPLVGPDSAHSGQVVVGTNLDGNAEPGVSTAHTGYPAIHGYGPMLLSWWQWWEYEDLNDADQTALAGGYLRFDDLPPGAPVPSVAYTHTLVSEDGTPEAQVFSGSSGQWRRHQLFLAEEFGFPGRITFVSDVREDNHWGDGWYLDDILLQPSRNDNPPAPFELLLPFSGHELQEPTVAFRWRSSRDEDPGAEVNYTLLLEDQWQRKLTFPCGRDTSAAINLETEGWYVGGAPSMTWRVIAVSQGDTVASGSVRQLLNPHAAADGEELPLRFAFTDPWPNPFNSELHVAFTLPRETAVTLEIHNVLGRRVARLHKGTMRAGNHRFSWRPDGRASGIYFVSLRAGKESALRKTVYLK